nr:putative integron gene cassette protein [uncultured bacterium]
MVAIKRTAVLMSVLLGIVSVDARGLICFDPSPQDAFRKSDLVIYGAALHCREVSREPEVPGCLNAWTFFVGGVWKGEAEVTMTIWTD